MSSGSALVATVETKSMTAFAKIKAILYDMDGLLLDTENFYTDVTQQIVSRYGKNFDWSIKSQMLGRPALESARTLVRVLELPIRPEDYLMERKALLNQRVLFEARWTRFNKLRALIACMVTASFIIILGLGHPIGK